MSDQESNHIYYVQTAVSQGPVAPQSSDSNCIDISSEKLKEIAGLVETSWSDMVSKISGMPNPPSEIGIEFGIDVGAEGGIPFITKGSIGANFKVTINWKQADS